ncbi:NXPE family member 3-like isoform X7 [Brienomyrus brachyistius]|uniref:NXPE family member 3-like isoform X7 n=2 Tax=Brienomyrus brachyistius TaxID=42636 RepID=UPI0020B35615|nr:NXPE family member 3-like isoform X7 [Brienomyrus brachyistius]
MKRLILSCQAWKSTKMFILLKRALVFLIAFLIVFLYLMTKPSSTKWTVPKPMSHHLTSYPMFPHRRCIPLLNTTHSVVHVPTSQSYSTIKYVLMSTDEWEFLQEKLCWPPPTIENPTPIEATDPRKCTFTVFNWEDNYTVGDYVNVSVVAKNGRGVRKAYGGDFFQAKLYNTELKASTFGLVIDHDNGTYSVSFALLWPGSAHVSIRLIHSSEAVQVLSRHRERDPDKVFFTGYFEDGNIKENVVCNGMKSPRLVGDGSRCCCEYRDPRSGEVWFCRRPSSLPCSALVYHSMGGYQAQLSTNESKILDRGNTNIVLPGSSPVINIFAQHADIREHKKCAPNLDTPVPSGFFFEDRWTSLVCHTKVFSSSDVIRCLTGKQIHMMGDSTLRQWFEYLGKAVPTLKPLNLHTSGKSGPLMIVDTESGILITWRAHGLPLRTNKTPMADLHYITNEIDNLAGGERMVIAFDIWAHFTTYPLAFYVNRLVIIRRSVVSLLQRAPRTLVIIKSANTGYKDVYGSDWLSWQLDCTLRAMFQGLPVVLIDTWQMTSCHYSPENIHPVSIVIENEVNLFLSFICLQ